MRQAHFHHVHLNATDPASAIDFYTSKFKARKESFAGLGDAVWTGDSWLLFTKVDAPPPSELLSGIWHIGWGAEDMQSTYQQQLAKGTRFATPITDISDMVGGNRPFFYAYVDGPDHVLIELNTARHHNFGHVHMFSADPPAAGAWYAKQFGFRSLPRTEKRVYRGRADRAGSVRHCRSRQHDHLSGGISRRRVCLDPRPRHRSPGFQRRRSRRYTRAHAHRRRESDGRAAQPGGRSHQVRLHRRPGPGGDRADPGRDARAPLR